MMGPEHASSEPAGRITAGIWMLDFASGAVWCSDGLLAVTGLAAAGATLPLADFLAAFTPGTAEVLSRSIERCHASGDDWMHAVELLRPPAAILAADGAAAIRNLCLRGAGLRRGGSVAGISGELFDAESDNGAALAGGGRGDLLSARFAAILDAASVQLAVHTPDGVMLMQNRANRLITGDGAVGRYFWQTESVIRFPEEGDQTWSMFKRAVVEAKPVADELTFDFGADGIKQLIVSFTPVVENGKTAFVVGQGVDLTSVRETERSLRQSETLFRETFECAPIGMALIDTGGRFVGANATLCAMLGYTREEMLGKRTVDVRPESSARWPELKRLLKGEVIRLSRQAQWIHKSGQLIESQIDTIAVRDENGRVNYFISQVQDISERKRFEDRLYHEKELAQVTLSSIADGVIRTDAWGTITYCNEAALRLTSCEEADILGKPFDEVVKLVTEGRQKPLPSPVKAVLAGDEAPPSAFAMLATEEHMTAIEHAVAPLHNRMGEIIGAVFVIHDVTQTRALASQLRHQAQHDYLTGLPNRRECESAIDLRLASARQNGSRHALLYLDLDRFKLVNDTCGHSAGDRMLREVSSLLRRKLRSSDMVARLGGDEFAVLLDNCPPERALHIAHELVAVLESFRFTFGQRSFRVGGSIGVVVLDASTLDVNQALSEADTACYIAKNRGRSRVQLYQRGDEEVLRTQRDMSWATRIEEALQDGSILIYAQRIVALDDSGPDSYELLVRKRDGEGKLILPGQFLPAAERFGLMGRIERMVLQRTLERIEALGEGPTGAGYRYLSINLSGTSLSDPEFVAFLEHELAEHNTPPHRVRFEITESTALHGIEVASECIARLRKKGYGFVLDDFGTGFTSFDYLKTLRVDGIKIDRSFTVELATDTVNQTIVEAICRIGQRLNMEIVAEGVEDIETLQALKALGVRHAQGWLFHKAEPLDTVLPLPEMATAQV